MLDELKNAMESYQDHSNHTIEEEGVDEELTSQPSLSTVQVNQRSGDNSISQTVVASQKNKLYMVGGNQDGPASMTHLSSINQAADEASRILNQDLRANRS